MENEKQEQGLIVKDFSEMGVSQRSKQSVYTTIQDERVLFNLQSATDYKLNDCKGETIRVKGLFMKFIEKPLEKPEVNEETGELDGYKYRTILFGDDGKTYASGAYGIYNTVAKILSIYGVETLHDKGLKVEIAKGTTKGNKTRLFLKVK